MAEGEHFYRLLAFHLRPEWQEAATLGTSRERAASAEALRQEEARCVRPVRVGCVRVEHVDGGRQAGPGQPESDGFISRATGSSCWKVLRKGVTRSDLEFKKSCQILPGKQIGIGKNSW